MNGEVLHRINDTLVCFRCPGCGDIHQITIRTDDPANRPSWIFNGDMVRPTFEPSILVTSGHFMAGHKEGKSCWCKYNKEHPEDPSPFECFRCHSFVTNGNIQFCPDSSHKFAGQTLPLKPWDEPKFCDPET